MRSRTLCLCIALVPALLVTAVAPAAPPPQAPPTDPSRPAQPADRPPAAPLFDVSFPGGNVKEYLEAVRRAHPGARVVIMPGVERFPMPPVDLQSVTLDAAIRVAADRQDYSIGKLNAQAFPVEGANELLYRVWLETRGYDPRSGVWSLSALLDTGKPHGLKPEDVLSAVQTALSLFDTPATVKYHQETQLLLARGSQDQIDQIGKVLAELEHAQDQRDAAQHSRPEQKQ